MRPLAMAGGEGHLESSSGFLSHLEQSHRTCLEGVNHIPDVMNDMRVFRSAVCGLPNTEAVKVISCIQEVRCTDEMILLRSLPGADVSLF